MKKIQVILLSVLFVAVPFGVGAVDTLAVSQFSTPLRFGTMNSPEVVNLQNFLIERGYLNYQATGNFLSLTKEAVTSFQRDNGLPTTGYFGPLSIQAANKVLLAKGKSNAIPAKVSVKSVARSGNAASVILSNVKSVEWQTDSYPASVGVNINLLKKVSDSPVSYTLVRQIATDTANDGKEDWVSKAGEAGSDFYIEVTCSTSHTFSPGCNISGDPIKAF